VVGRSDVGDRDVGCGVVIMFVGDGGVGVVCCVDVDITVYISGVDVDGVVEVGIGVEVVVVGGVDIVVVSGVGVVCVVVVNMFVVVVCVVCGVVVVVVVVDIDGFGVRL